LTPCQKPNFTCNPLEAISAMFNQADVRATGATGSVKTPFFCFAFGTVCHFVSRAFPSRIE
jgi:hypothetical protein